MIVTLWFRLGFRFIPSWLDHRQYTRAQALALAHKHTLTYTHAHTRADFNNPLDTRSWRLQDIFGSALEDFALVGRLCFSFTFLYQGIDGRIYYMGLLRRRHAQHLSCISF
jgi:hypothetical protein